MKKFVTRVLAAVMLMATLITGIPYVAEPAEAASNIVMNGVDIGYSDGSYFTKNGRSCKNTYWASGRCHKNGVCDATTHSQCNCMRYWPTGVKSTAQVDLLSSQCFAFARYCQWRVYGYHDGANSSKFTDLGGLSYSNCTAANLKSKLNGCAAATHIRTKSSGKGWAHSVSVVSTSNSGITIADCNSDGYCKVRQKYYSWADFASYMKEYGGVSYINAPKAGSTHTHSYKEYYETAHPHKLLMKCTTCGNKYYTGGTYTVKDCASCNGCSCSTSYAGEYKCTTSSANLTIRSGHGTGYSKVGSIPSGATVTVSKANGSWAHVTYNGVSGYASMQYLQKKTPAHAETPTLRWWLSESAYGDAASTLTAGKSYYFCYRLYDSVTGKDWDEVSNNSYNVKLTVYAPDGSTVYSWNNSSDTGWIRTYYGTSGSYSRELVLTGDFSFNGKRSYTVSAPVVKMYASTTSANLTLGGTESVKLKVWDSDNIVGSYYYNCSRSNSNVSCSWGSWADDGSIPLTITAKKRGTTTITLSVKSSANDKTLATVTIYVNVGAKTYTVYYNANGGTGAPSAQTKYHGTTLKLSSVAPTRNGYTFKGWAKSSTATTPDFSKGGSYTANVGDTLYAVWVKNSSIFGVYIGGTGVNLGLIGSAAPIVGAEAPGETEGDEAAEPRETEDETPAEDNVEGSKPADETADDATAESTVDAAQPTLESVTLTALPAKTGYISGEELDLAGMTVTALYSDGSTVTVTDDCTVEGYDPAKTGEQTVTVTYGGKSVTFTVTVTEPAVSGDINGDDVVNSIDMSLLSRKLNGGSVSGDAGGDINGDGRVTAADLALLRRMISGAKA